MLSSIALVGCGWFGLALGKELVSRGYRVTGSKRTKAQAEQLSDYGIAGFELDLDRLPIDEQTCMAQLECDAIVINIPPGLRRSGGNAEADYLERLGRLKKMIACHTYQKVIFISTTGVYPANGQRVSEADAAPFSSMSQTLLQAEAVFSDAVVVRFAGLMGPKRHPGRFLAGKTGLGGANLSVNMTHQYDAVTAIITLLESQSPLAPIYNVCSPHHPSKRDFYQQAAKRLGLPLPEFASDGEISEDKIVEGHLICEQLDFTYRHQDLFDALSFCE
ncbi:SDR family oxidoreductase [Shewanella sp. AS1]|uniref:SDR family oxidoreductase n=1 Tax=Shewanella sp. AS1 TaxID=2907626 RepID=UPI001F3316B8|nr:SDR family oxidoreductase [Shewanella sp. AS1]MCE9679580.1 SDR family oxidoreductase [Shewanella sp. AS1]